ncbi:hypothetical protein KY290_012865 [Solanum tuberosum]|uniref:Uncharacterized protein n=1 Tax=Solanum tuberosum TaxID=4113 RepID=A0ABQ7VMB5_SOLTU|nr:hypothetical protein KY290_012865 [Solanum tuberosum]
MSGAILKPSKMPRGMWVYAGSRGVPRPGPRQHRPRPARIGRGMWASGQATSANVRRHQPRPARIGRGMCASGKRRRPTTGSISQGLDASDVACAQRSADVGRGLAALPLA